MTNAPGADALGLIASLASITDNSSCDAALVHLRGPLSSLSLRPPAQAQVTADGLWRCQLYANKATATNFNAKSASPPARPPARRPATTASPAAPQQLKPGHVPPVPPGPTSVWSSLLLSRRQQNGPYCRQNRPATTAGRVLLLSARPRPDQPPGPAPRQPRQPHRARAKPSSARAQPQPG
jgi:hypothetical protein